MYINILFHLLPCNFIYNVPTFHLHYFKKIPLGRGNIIWPTLSVKNRPLPGLGKSANKKLEVGLQMSYSDCTPKGDFFKKKMSSCFGHVLGA